MNFVFSELVESSGSEPSKYEEKEKGEKHGVELPYIWCEWESTPGSSREKARLRKDEGETEGVNGWTLRENVVSVGLPCPISMDKKCIQRTHGDCIQSHGFHALQSVGPVSARNPEVVDVT